MTRWGKKCCNSKCCRGPKGFRGPTGPTGPAGGGGFTFFVQTLTSSGTGATGSILSISQGDTLRFNTDGGLVLEETSGSVNIRLEPNNIFVTDDPANFVPPNPDIPNLIVDSNTNQIYTWTGTMATSTEVVPGVEGATGPNGVTGSTGATGSVGPIGPTGAVGITGSKGETGTTGLKGATGKSGTNSNTGTTGSTGVTGVTGSQGLQGSIGMTGITGLQGTQGATGATGAIGVQGAQGETGIPGSATNTGPTGTVGTVGGMGPTGPTGPAGDGGTTNLTINPFTVFDSGVTVTTESVNGLEGGLNNVVRAVDSEGTTLYVGGEFTAAGGDSSIQRIGVYDIVNKTWSALSTPLSNVRAIELDRTNSTTISIFQGGSNRVSVWNGSSWTVLGGGLFNSFIDTLQVRTSPQTLYAGGNFTTAPGGTTVNYVSLWDGSTWTSMDSGVSAPVLAFALDSNNDLYVGGIFTDAGTSMTNAKGIAKWTVTLGAWSSLGITTGSNPGSISVRAITVDSSDNVYIGGNFLSINGIANTQNIAMWDGSNWNALGTGLNQQCLALSYEESTGDIIAGGSFTETGGAGGQTLNRIARWDGSSWKEIGQGHVSSSVIDLSTLEIENTRHIFPGGAFTASTETNGAVIDTLRVADWATNIVSLPEPSSITTSLNALGDGFYSIIIDRYPDPPEETEQIITISLGGATVLESLLPVTDSISWSDFRDSAIESFAITLSGDVTDGILGTVTTRYTSFN